MRQTGTALAVLVLALLVGLTRPVAAQDGEFLGPHHHRVYDGQEPFEHLDTATGALRLTFTDLVLPGNAGRALAFQRTFDGMHGSWRFGLAGTRRHPHRGPHRL